MNPVTGAVPTLDSWSARPWRGGTQIDTLSSLDVVRVRTRNTRYEITVLDAARGEVIVRGGRHFPDHTRAILLGSSLGGAFLKVRGIYPGFCLEIAIGLQRVVTTPVASVSTGAPALQS